MIRHIVLFNLKPEIETADREWLLGQIRDLANIPGVKGLAVGKLLEPREDWYKARIAPDYGWALSMEFEDEDALYGYQTDPYHVATAQEIRKRVSVVKVADFVS
jgi:hypothetical protein